MTETLSEHLSPNLEIYELSRDTFLISLRVK